MLTFGMFLMLNVAVSSAKLGPAIIARASSEQATLLAAITCALLFMDMLILLLGYMEYVDSALDNEVLSPRSLFLVVSVVHKLKRTASAKRGKGCRPLNWIFC